MTAMVHVYFDESESRADQILCVGGYLFKKDSAEKLGKAWMDVLEPHGIKIFHMVDCAHGSGEFKSLGKSVRIEIQKALFEILKARAESGVIISFDLRYASLLPSSLAIGIKILSPYALCCYFCMMFARHWASKKHYKGKIAYFFETGHEHRAEANRIMEEIFSSRG